jgi:protein SCO1/2
MLMIAAGISIGTWAWLRQGPAAWVGVSNAPQRLEIYGEVPSFSLVGQTGQEVTRSALDGKVWIANFIFTSCRLTCPQQSATMARLQADLQGEPDLRLVSITVDPDHDTPEVLTRYAGRFHADPRRWFFLTGDEQAIYTLAHAGFRLSTPILPPPAQTQTERARSGGSAAPGSQPTSGLQAVSVTGDPTDALIHDARFALVDRAAQIRGYYSSLDPEAMARLRDDVLTLLKEGR